LTLQDLNGSMEVWFEELYIFGPHAK